MLRCSIHIQFEQIASPELGVKILFRLRNKKSLYYIFSTSLSFYAVSAVGDGGAYYLKDEFLLRALPAVVLGQTG